MSDLGYDQLYGNRLIFSANQRRITRFTLKHQHLWSIKLNGRVVPVEYVQDLNWTGCCLRIKDAAVALEGHLLRFEVFFRNELVFAVMGKVRWVKEASTYLKIFHIGLEFIDPDQRVRRLWQDKGITELTMVAPDTTSGSRSAQNPKTRPRRLSADEDWITKCSYIGLISIALAAAYYLIKVI